jgi:hypothetical protein
MKTAVAYLASLLEKHEAKEHAPASDDSADPAACDS